MGKRKLKISLHRVRETKELWMVLHINVYRKEERNFTAVHLFLMVRNLSDFGFYYLVLIFQNFQFLAYSRSYSVHFSFSTFFSVSRHNAGPTVYFSHFSRFSVLLAIFHIIQCAFLIFHPFQCFLPYFRSNNICVSFFTYFSFLAIILVLQCVFLIFHVFQCFFFCLISHHTVCVSHFP